MSDDKKPDEPTEVIFTFDAETAERLEQVAKDFGETPEQLIKSLIRLEWEKAKKAGKVGSA